EPRRGPAGCPTRSTPPAGRPRRTGRSPPRTPAGSRASPGAAAPAWAAAGRGCTTSPPCGSGCTRTSPRPSTRRAAAGGHPAREPAEDPRVGQRPAADGDPVAAGLFDHPGGVGDRPHVAVAEDRDAFDRLDHPADAVVADAAREPLLAGPAVDRHRGDAGPLELPGEVRGRQVRVVPPEPHL